MSRSAALRGCLIAGLALAAAACVPVEPLTAPDRPGDTPLASLLPAQADLVCVHEAAPPWMFDSIGFARLRASLDRGSALKRACPKFHGQGLRGRWVSSYRTLVISLKDCRVVSVNAVQVGGYERDGAPEDFCAPPERLALIDAPWGKHEKIIIDTKKRPDDLGNTPR